MVHYDIYLKTVIRCLASSIFVVSVGAGCSITYKPIHATVPTVLNPISKRTVRIDEVKDCRRFVKTSGWAGQPVPHIVFSKDDTPERRARCIEVYHCLPEGETVESVIGDTLVKAFRTQGYRVLKQGDPGYAEAKSV
ncbi:MAG: hypothetical protein HN341_03755, partial [Verrucomicrobia bacterium]|nr:hypothetical protein [Verrucomicrobiota bacterium]